MKRTAGYLITAAVFGSMAMAHAATIADWRFEEGTPGVQHAGDHDNFYADTSGNGNHLSAWEATGNPTATSDLPFVSQGGVTNVVALDFDSASNQNLGSFGPGDIHDKPIDSHSFSNGWTIEATFKTRSYWWSVIIGKDGQPGAPAGEANLAFKVRDDSHSVECGFYDDATNWVWLATEPIDLGRWYSVAATYDDASSTYSLFLKQQDGGAYVLQGTVTNVTAGAALNLGTQFWSVGRGMWGGNPGDVFNGLIDEVRISDVALDPSEFINQDGFTIPFDIEKPHSVVSSGFVNWDQSFSLAGSEYWSPVGYAFAGSQWQISSSTDFSSPEWDSGALGSEATPTVPANALTAGSYYGRVRYQGDAVWSDWSDATLLKLVIVDTIAYWRFETSTFDPQPVDGVEHAGDQDDWYEDISGNGNHMSSWWEEGRPMATSDVPTTLIPGIGGNTLAVDFDRGTGGTEGLDDLSTVGGKMIDSYSFINGWTMECTFKARDLDGWQTVFGKDGKPGGGDEPTFGFILAPSAESFGIRCFVIKDDLAFDFIDTAEIVVDKWYTVVATYDNVDFKIYLKSEDDTDFILQNSLNRPQGIMLGNGTFSYSWTVGRGVWGGNPNFWFNGQVDEVRVSNGALLPSSFVQSLATIPPIGNIGVEDLGTGNLALTWNTGSFYDYMLLEKTNLQSPTWSTNRSGIAGTETNVTVTVSTDPEDAAFYRVISED